MTIILSNNDAVLLAIPMVGLLFAGFFRLDELFGKSKKPVRRQRPAVTSDETGRPLYADPDGRVPHRKARKS